MTLPQPSLKEVIKALVALRGGTRECARYIATDQSNIPKWLSGFSDETRESTVKTLSKKKIADLLEYIGLIDFQPFRGRVHVWRVRGWQLGALTTAYKYFYPYDAEMRVAPWSSIHKERIQKLARNLFTAEVHAFERDNLRALVRTLPSHILRYTNGKFEFGGFSLAYKVLKVKIGPPWTEGEPTIEQFDKAWGKSEEPGQEELAAAVKMKGMTVAQAIDWIMKYVP
jgi:hypothetical protein